MATDTAVLKKTSDQLLERLGVLVVELDAISARVQASYDYDDVTADDFRSLIREQNRAAGKMLGLREAVEILNMARESA